MKIENIIQQMQVTAPIKLLVALTCILITVFLCYLFSILYIKFTDPIEIPQHIFALEQQSFPEIQDKRLINGARIYTTPSFLIYREDKTAASDCNNLY